MAKYIHSRHGAKIDERFVKRGDWAKIRKRLLERMRAMQRRGRNEQAKSLKKELLQLDIKSVNRAIQIREPQNKRVQELSRERDRLQALQKER